MSDTTAHAHSSSLAHHFDDMEQQTYAAELGMWLFLVTEFMFFGGLFMAYLVYRNWYPDDFATTSHSMNLVLGTINTTVLLASSLTMALAVHAAHESNRRRLVFMLVSTLVLGAAFLGIKAYEYHHKYVDGLIPFASTYAPNSPPGQDAFLNLYFLMTGLHAFHMVIGMVLLLILAVAAWRGGLLGDRAIIVHNSGLYWHFVDLVWIYLFPFFYLVALRGNTPGGP